MKLPEEIIFNNRKYIIERQKGTEDFDGDVFISYIPEVNLPDGDNLPIYVHDKECWYYLVAWSHSTWSNSEEAAEEDMWERLNGAKEYYPEIEEAIKKYNI